MSELFTKALERQLLAGLRCAETKAEHGFFQRLRRLRQSCEASDLADLSQAIQRSVEAVNTRQQSLPHLSFPEQLPISQRQEELIVLLKKHQVLVVAGETGSGKSTQLPKMCLAAGLGVRGRIAHTQPRRIAARALSKRLASELGCELGAGVGFKVRFDERIGKSDYIRVLTDGMLLAETESDRFLSEYDTIIVDEAHERSLNIDVLLGLLKRLVRQRPNLKLVITSATIDTARFSEFFDGAPVVEVSGRTFPVELQYQALPEAASADVSLNKGILEAVNTLFERRPGNALVFLPGEREIREGIRYLEKHLKQGVEVLPLYSRLSPKEQSRLFAGSGRTRIILSTNVAETSLTLPGIDYVIDSGLARVSRYSAARRVNSLPIERISKAAANQRMGRCGRVANGVCIRLFDEDDFNSRADYTLPEILRTSVAAVQLMMLHRGFGALEQFPLLEEPAPRQLQGAWQELQLLNAVSAERKITPLGRKIARLPVDPRVGAMLLAAEQEQCLQEMIIIAAAIEVPDPRLTPHDHLGAARQAHQTYAKPQSDFSVLLQLWQDAAKALKGASRKEFMNWCDGRYLSAVRIREWRELSVRLAQDLTKAGCKINKEAASEDAVHRALLHGFLDAIAIQSEKGGYEGAFGKKITLHPSSMMVKKPPKWMLAAELIETNRLYARMVAPIQVSWLEQIGEKHLQRSYSQAHWANKSGHVLAFERATLFGLPVYQGRKRPITTIDPPLAHELFIQQALVAEDFDSEADFFVRNQALRHEIEEREHKMRRHDLLVDEPQRFAFYADKLPKTVCSKPSLDKWLKSLSAQARAVLIMTEDDLLAKDYTDSAEQTWPDYTHTTVQKLPLSYLYAPESERDGVTATVPLPVLNQLKEPDIERLVPAYFEAKLTALVKTLPKKLRKRYVPVPNTVAAIISVIEADSRSLLVALASALTELNKGAVRADDMDVGQLGDEYKMNIELVSKTGDVLAMSRDLNSLQAEYASQAQQRVSNVRQEIEQDGLQEWPETDVPERFNTRVDGVDLVLFPALVDEGKSVAVRCFQRQEEAQRAHAKGLARLFLVATEQGRAWSKKPLPYGHQLSMAYSSLGSAEQLKDDVLMAVVRAIWPKTGTTYNQADFRVQTQKVAESFTEHLQRLCAALAEAFSLQSNFRAASDKLASSVAKDSLADMRTQQGFLIYSDFMSEVPVAEALRYPVYFKALLKRLEQVLHNPQADVRKQQQFALYWQQYAAHWQQHIDSKALEHYRWLLESYRISVFAQSMRAPQPASEKKLKAAWLAFKQEQGL